MERGAEAEKKKQATGAERQASKEEAMKTSMDMANVTVLKLQGQRHLVPCANPLK